MAFLGLKGCRRLSIKESKMAAEDDVISKMADDIIVGCQGDDIIG